MNHLYHKSKRAVKKRPAVLLAVAVVLVVLYNFTAISQLINLAQPSSNVLDPTKSDGTIPFAELQLMRQKEAKEAESANSKKMDKFLNLVQTEDKSLLLMGYTFFNKVFDILAKGEPKIPKLDTYQSDDRIYHAGYDGDSKYVFTEKYLSSFLKVSNEHVKHLQSKHELVVNSLPNSAPAGLYKGDGIVYIGGGKFNWLALLSIKSLRGLGSKLPVEIIIPTIAEYEVDLCTRIFPALNAKCVLLPHVLGDTINSNFQFKGYQYKALALIVSSFENVLLIDADNIPARAPDYLFDSEPFKSHGLITWPDFWRRATSPDYYKIANIKITKERVRFGYDDREKKSKPKTNEIPFHDFKGTIPDPTSESGQLMISKKTHSKELFLALYYNLYGPDFYYPLFSQGSDGEGDKETFLAATVALGSKYYQVKKFLNAFGHFNVDREFIGCGMGQYDPVEDYNNEQLKKSGEADLIKNDPKILFVHANFPKLNPIALKEDGKIFEKTGERIRLYGPGMAKRVGYDFELTQWKNMQFLICDLKIELDVFKKYKLSQICKEVGEHLKFLEESAQYNEVD